MRRLEKSLFISLLFIISFNLSAQRWTNFTTSSTSMNKYLCNNVINKIIIDKHGNKWIGTDDGVSKFDGTNWTTYTISDGLADNYIRTIAIDASDNIWFGTNNGISKFNGLSWVTYRVENGLADNIVTSIAFDKYSAIWIGTANGLSKFDGEIWTSYTTKDGLIHDDIRTISIDDQDNKWIGTLVGMSKFDNVTWSTYTTNNGLASNKILDIKTYKDEIWIGTYDEGISKFKGKEWTTYNRNNGLKSNIINSITIDSNGFKWISTSFGISKYDGISWDDCNSIDSLPFPQVLTIAIDNQNVKWIGTSLAGLVKYDNTRWTTYGLYKSLVSNIINRIYIDKQGNKWIGTWGGVSKFDDSNWSNYTITNGLKSVNVNSIITDEHGFIWFATDFGIAKFDGNKWSYYTTEDGLIDNSVKDICIDKQGNKWFGTTHGVSKFDGKNWVNYSTVNGLVNDYIFTVTPDNYGNIWFGTLEGVSKFDGKNWTKFTEKEGLAGSEVRAIVFEANGVMWFGTNNGVSKFDGENWTKLTMNDGLSMNIITSIAIEKNGSIWFGGIGGLSKFDGKIWTIYEKNDGLINDNIMSIAIDSLGTKWIGTQYGMSKFVDNPNTVTDADGNTYKTVTIGTQTWFAENLRTTKYNDGTAIPNVNDSLAWENLTTPAYCWYNNDKDSIGKIYGVLYNWYTVNTGKLCPIGWHVPSNNEWDKLETFLISYGYNFDNTTTGNKIGKSLASNSNWGNYYLEGTVGNHLASNNSSGFSAYPGGNRSYTGTSNGLGYLGLWWSSTELMNLAYSRSIVYAGEFLSTNGDHVNIGCSIRCLKDTSISIITPILSTYSATNIGITLAKSGGNITSDGGASVTVKGVCWSTKPHPTIDNSKTTDGTGTGYFPSNITGLIANTTYYVRAYATNSAGTAYRNEFRFTTLDNSNTVTDADGNTYKTVTIGTQTWFAENLRTTKYNDGTAIPNVTDNTDWGNLTTPAYCWYNNDANSYKADYGALYNWYTVETGKLCPTGWHVPSNADWTTLTDYLGGANVAGGKLKEIGNTHWIYPNTGAANSSEFDGLPGGYRNNLNSNGTFTFIGSYALWWSSTEGNIGTAFGQRVGYDYSSIYNGAFSNNLGFSVRCLKNEDQTISIPTLSTTSASNIGITTAQSGGNITSDGGASVTVRGVCWSTSPNPTIANNKITDGTGTGNFTSSIIGLTANTTYYVRAYATNSAGTAYGNEVSFKTLPADAKMPQTITFKAFPRISYGHKDFAVYATASSGLPLVLSSSDTTVASIDTNNMIHVKKLGQCYIKAYQAGNDTLFAVRDSQRLVVQKALLFIVADDKTKTCGKANPTFTCSYYGFVNGEDQSVLVTKPIASTEADRTSPTGEYIISPAGASAHNYDINYINGLFTITPIKSAELYITTCAENFTLPGGSIINESGIYHDTIVAVNGCDSVVTLDITFVIAETRYTAKHICQGDAYQVGKSIYTQTGTYHDTLISVYGCDSLYITTQLMVDPLPSVFAGIDTSICSGTSATLTATGTGNVYWLNANKATITVSPEMSTNYRAYATNSCGKVYDKVRVDVVTTPETPEVFKKGNKLAALSDAPVQWYEVKSGAIDHATEYELSPNFSGSYFVIAQNGMCYSDTSNILAFTVVNAIEKPLTAGTEVFPNPVYEAINIKSSKTIHKVEVYNCIGKLVEQKTGENKFSLKLSAKSWLPGVYFVKITSAEKDGKTIVKSIVKK